MKTKAVVRASLSGALVAICACACGSSSSRAPASASSQTANAPSAAIDAPPAPSVVAADASASAVVASPLLPPATDGFVNVRGLEMHYSRQGKGPTLVLLQAGTGSAELCWSAALPFFAQRFDVIAPDQLGHGKTHDDAKRPMSYHPMAEDTVALLDKLGVTQAAFVGWSDGGVIALDIAMHHPSLVTKLVATGANYSVEGLDPQAVAFVKGVKAADWIPEVRESYAKLSPDGAEHWPVVFDRIRKMWLSEPRWSVKDLATIKSPALVVAGDHDMVRTPHTVELASAIPNAQLAILPGATHEVVLEDAPRWNAVVMTFLTAPPPKMEK